MDGIQETIEHLATIDLDHGDVQIATVRRWLDPATGETLQPPTLAEHIGYHDDVDEVDEKIERAHRQLKVDAATRKKRHDRAKALIKLARQDATPRISKAEHQRLKAADQAAREMEEVRREVLGPENMAETKNAAARKGA